MTTVNCTRLLVLFCTSVILSGVCIAVQMQTSHGRGARGRVPLAATGRLEFLELMGGSPAAHEPSVTRKTSQEEGNTSQLQAETLTCLMRIDYTQAPNKDSNAAPQISMIADARKPAIRVGSVTSAQQDRQSTVYDTSKRRKHDSLRYNTSKYDDGNQSRDNDS